MKDRVANILKMSDDLGAMIASMQRMYDLLGQMAATTHHLVGDLEDAKATADELRDHLADFDDFATTRPRLRLRRTALFSTFPSTGQ